MDYTAEPPINLQRPPLTNLRRAAKLITTLTQFRRDSILCDVFLQSQTVANETLTEKTKATNKTDNKTASGTLGEELDQASNEATGEASSDAGSEALSEASGEAGDKVEDEATNSTANNIRGVPAHRAVLAAASPAFHRELFRSTENQSKVVVIPNVEQGPLQAMVEYIYSPSSLALTVENASELAAAAEQLQVAGVREITYEFMARVLEADNALHVHAFAEQHNFTELAATASRLIDSNGEQILQGEEILTLSSDALVAFIDRNQLAASEERVLDTVLRWTLYRPEERRQDLLMLLDYVRLELVPREILSERIKVEPLKSAGSEALVNVIRILSNDQESVESRMRAAARNQYGSREFRSARLHTAQPQASPPQAALLVAGGKVGNSCTDTVLIYSLLSRRWEPVSVLPSPRNSSSAVLLGGTVYLIAGDNGISATDTVFKYDVGTNTWSSGPGMKIARCWLGASALDGRIYAVGGWSGENINLNSVEALDPREDKWISITNMKIARRALGVSTLDGKLYAVGGHDDNSPLNTTERYNPTANKWELMQDMRERRAGVAVGVVNDVLYAVGGVTRFKMEGRKKTIVLQSVEQYHAGSRWEPALPMDITRRGAAVTADDGRLYVVGGFYNANAKDFTSKVSVLDPVKAAWSDLSELPEGRAGSSAVVIYR